MTTKLSKKFIEAALAVTAKRPKTVIDHILAHGQITTDDLKLTYGYNHPPRAARDVREHGIGLKTIRVLGPDGRRIAAYVFDEAHTTQYSKRAGRTALSSQLKANLIDEHGARCFIYQESMESAQLQVDHRIPFEVAGEAEGAARTPNDFMLLCPSANRAKSWSCEHCPNWLVVKDPAVCRACYWAYPESYTHVATLEQRRLDVVWDDHEVVDYELARDHANSLGQELPGFVKAALRKLTGT